MLDDHLGVVGLSLLTRSPDHLVIASEDQKVKVLFSCAWLEDIVRPPQCVFGVATPSLRQVRPRQETIAVSNLPVRRPKFTRIRKHRNRLAQFISARP